MSPSNDKVSHRGLADVTTGFEVSFELALLASAGALGLGIMAGWHWGQWWHHQSHGTQGNPLRRLINPDSLVHIVDLSTHRHVRHAGSHAVLRARIDRHAGMRAGWDAGTCEQVAAVMRAGLRRGDRVASDGDNYTIVIHGADEPAAVRTANRLRRALAQLRLPHMTRDARLTASFGVAADRIGAPIGAADRQARRALHAARLRGADHVVPASELQEILYLPAPTPVASAAASAA